jgi:hypothetical protein
MALGLLNHPPTKCSDPGRRSETPYRGDTEAESAQTRLLTVTQNETSQGPHGYSRYANFLPNFSPQSQSRVRRKRSGCFRDLGAQVEVSSVGDEQRLIQDTVRRFVVERVLPIAVENDINHTLDMELIEAMAELGILGIVIPEQYGAPGSTMSPKRWSARRSNAPRPPCAR